MFEPLATGFGVPFLVRLSPELTTLTVTWVELLPEFGSFTALETAAMLVADPTLTAVAKIVSVGIFDPEATDADREHVATCPELVHVQLVPLPDA